MLRTFGFSALLLALAITAPSAQGRSTLSCDDDHDWDDERASHCEMREETLAGGNPLDVDAGPNGGIRVRGWERSDVVVRARIIAYADTENEARQVASQVRIETGGGQVRARGPEAQGDRRWNVSYEINAPQNGQLTLNTNNGGISVRDLRGTVRFRARNGGINLENVAGDFKGETSNGGISVDLSGNRWDGEGLDVETNNGGVKIDMPEQYSAELEAGTTNGRLNIDFPVTVQGSLGKHINTTIGGGGAKIRAITTNGGVSIRRR